MAEERWIGIAVFSLVAFPRHGSSRLRRPPLTSSASAQLAPDLPRRRAAAPPGPDLQRSPPPTSCATVCCPPPTSTSTAIPPLPATCTATLRLFPDLRRRRPRTGVPPRRRPRVLSQPSPTSKSTSPLPRIPPPAGVPTSQAGGQGPAPLNGIPRPAPRSPDAGRAVLPCRSVLPRSWLPALRARVINFPVSRHQLPPARPASAPSRRLRAQLPSAAPQLTNHWCAPALPTAVAGTTAPSASHRRRAGVSTNLRLV